MSCQVVLDEEHVYAGSTYPTLQHGKDPMALEPITQHYYVFWACLTLKVFKQVYSWSYFHVLHWLLWVVLSCKKMQGHFSQLLLGQLWSPSLSRRLLREAIPSDCFKLVYSALLQCCITGLMLCGNRGREGQAVSRACMQLGGGNWRHSEILMVSPKGGTEAIIKKPDLQGASQPVSTPAMS